MSSKAKGNPKPVGTTVDAIGEEVVRGDLIWASYRKQPMWPAMVKTVYPKKVTYVFLPLKDNASHQIFKGDTQSIRVLGSKDIVPKEAPKDLKEAFNFALKMINDGEVRDRTAQAPVKIEVDEKNDEEQGEMLIVEPEPKKPSKAKEAKPKNSEPKNPEPKNAESKKKAPAKKQETSFTSTELSPPPTIARDDVVIATSVDGSVSEWPAVVTKLERKFISIENNANGRSEYSDAFEAVLKHFGVETEESSDTEKEGNGQKENGADVAEHLVEEEGEPESRKRRTQPQGKVVVAEPKSQKLRRVVDDNLPSSATARRNLTLYEIMKSDETQGHLRDTLSTLYDKSYSMPTRAKFDFRFDAGDLLTYKELAELGVVASQVVKLHQGVPKMDPFTELDYVVSVVLPEMTIFGIMKWQGCSRDQAIKTLQRSRTRAGVESGEEDMAVDEVEALAPARTSNTLFESLVNAACHELSTNGHGGNPK
uniref:PWWP domain-containing protein n=1 Tax=Steinernema glaseri TaxID=37863 RepID=A0A1I7ZJX1_9BILA